MHSVMHTILDNTTMTIMILILNFVIVKIFCFIKYLISRAYIQYVSNTNIQSSSSCMITFCTRYRSTGYCEFETLNLH